MDRARGMDWRLLLGLYALVAVAFVVRTLYNAETIPLLADTDDAMRLAVVRDLLAGQGWYDNLQHRLNTPFGAELHWSRLADLPLAGFVLLFRPFLGTAAATAAAYAVPLLYLFVLLWLSGRVSLKFAGPEALLPGLALPAFSLSVLGEFAPGRVDHHSLQILLLMAMVWCSIEAVTRPRFAVGAGLAAATAIAIGIEGLPAIAAAILAFGLLWVAVPARADALRSFGLSFAAGTLVHLAIGVRPDRWLQAACDALSFTYAAAAVGVGIVFLVLSLLPLRERPVALRLGLGLAAGVALALLLGFAFPECLRGPYAALDPWLVEHWLNGITEAAPLWTSLAADPAYPLAVTVPVLVALAAIGLRLTRGPRAGRAEWWIYAAFLAVAVATMLIQIRASRMATPLAVPACAWLIALARERYLARASLPRAGVLVLSWLVSAGLAVGLGIGGVKALLPGPGGAAGADAGLAERRQCLMPEAFADLAAMPPERIMTPIDLGSHMLAFTPHAVVAAPYHRNQQGVRDAFAFYNGPIDEALPILARRGVTLVVICPAMPEMRGLADAAPDSFVRLYATGELPDWLVDVSLPGAPLKIYAVAPPGSPRAPP